MQASSKFCDSPGASAFVLLVCAIAIAIFSSCSNNEKKLLNIPAGQATQTLKEFARQARVDIIFDPQSVDGIQTHSVDGNYDPQLALRLMLKDTPLSVDFDSETGAYAIIRVELSIHSIRILLNDTAQVATYGYLDAETPLMIKKLNFF